MCWLFGLAKVVAGMTINSLIVFERFPVTFVGAAPPSKIGRHIGALCIRQHHRMRSRTATPT
jgi:hypothetical protein